MADQRRIYVIGASCAGVSTLGAALAEYFQVPQLDVDDFYWMPTDPPYTKKRPPEDRVRLIQNRQNETQGWILSGSFIGWGDALIRDVDLIVFLQTPANIRLQRLDQREAVRHGARILPGGDMHEAHLAFRDWASRYEDGSFNGRSLARHEAWLKQQSAQVLRLQGDCPTDELTRYVREHLSHPAKTN
ncbi:ATP-binding protein [Terrihabitans sp. B22-R8]|uniref:ATP-binding protein n=1 Tax=Terrihabitans sp. B22-R8 TaxID=3425128 RepID=UPI00403C04DB